MAFKTYHCTNCESRVYSPPYSEFFCPKCGVQRFNIFDNTAFRKENLFQGEPIDIRDWDDGWIAKKDIQAIIDMAESYGNMSRYYIDGLKDLVKSCSYAAPIPGESKKILKQKAYDEKIKYRELRARLDIVRAHIESLCNTVKEEE